MFFTGISSTIIPFLLSSGFLGLLLLYSGNLLGSEKTGYDGHHTIQMKEESHAYYTSQKNSCYTGLILLSPDQSSKNIVLSPKYLLFKKLIVFEAFDYLSFQHTIPLPNWLFSRALFGDRAPPHDLYLSEHELSEC